MIIACPEIIRTVRPVIYLRKVSADFQRTVCQQSAVTFGRAHDKVTRYLYEIGFVCHIERSCTVGEGSVLVFRLDKVISVYDQMSSVEDYVSSRLNEISVDGQCVSVKIEIAHRQIIIIVDLRISLKNSSY